MPHFFYYYSVVQVDIRNASSSSFIVHNNFSYPVLFACLLCVYVSPYYAENCAFKICEELCLTFYGSCIESVHSFIGMAISHIFSLFLQCLGILIIQVLHFFG